MNPYLARLCHLASQPSRRIIGLMSGTSLDGLDVALCRLQGHGHGTKLMLEHFATVPYDNDTRDRIRTVFAREQVSLKYLTLLNPWLGRLHAAAVLRCLHEWQVNPTEVDLVASHGQTVYHAPATSTSAQISPKTPPCSSATATTWPWARASSPSATSARST